MNDLPAVFFEHQPTGILQPVILSSPHSGTFLPPEIQLVIKNKFSQNPEDTDWFIDQLYDFAPAIGMTLITAKYSRYAIDLNRDPNGKRLYQDNRAETGLVPVRSFGNEELYEAGRTPDAPEIERRIIRYYEPYYAALTSRLQERRKQFGSVLFFDCHSIKRTVPSIRSAPFPDLIIGTQDGQTANQRLCAVVQASLAKHSNYDVAYNDPFKGGHLTRWFGKPDQGVHAIQLEMSQDLYLNSGTNQIDPEKWENVRRVLQFLLQDLAAELRSINETL
jgi:N-formylglutamate amidohydrolase